MGHKVSGTDSFEQITDFGSLYKAYKAAARGKHSRASVLRHDLHAEKILLRLQAELRSGRYKHGRYNQFTVQDPKPRDVNAAPFTDRVVHHALVDHIEPLFERGFIFDSYACRRGKGTHAAALKLQHFLRSSLNTRRPVYVLRSDIRKFFASINHSVLMRLLDKHIHDPQTRSLCKTIIGSYHTPPSAAGASSLSLDKPHGLPIGNLTSQLFANIYLNALDQFVKHGLRERYYLRYMDDFVILHHDKARLWQTLRRLETFTSDTLHLQLHPKKTGTHKFYELERFVGYDLGPYLRRLSKPTLRRFERRLKRMQSTHSPEDIETSLTQFKAYAQFAHTGQLLAEIQATHSEIGRAHV